MASTRSWLIYGIIWSTPVCVSHHTSLHRSPVLSASTPHRSEGISLYIDMRNVQLATPLKMGKELSVPAYCTL